MNNTEASDLGFKIGDIASDLLLKLTALKIRPDEVE